MNAPTADSVAASNVVELTAGGVTLLTYSLLPFPSPLLASAPAQLTLVVSNSRSQFVTVTSITVTLRVGTNAKDLTSGASGIGTQLPDGWGAEQTGGIFTLTPATPGAARVGPTGLAFVFTGITANDQPGSCPIAIGEEASTPGQPAAQRTTTLPLAKFPPTFALGELTVSAPSVAFGGSVVLFWNGSPATYVLSYDPDGNGATPHLVGANGPYTAASLTEPVVVFTLSATVTVPGEDEPLVFQRQAVITVTVPVVTLVALPTIVGTNGVTKLTWQTSGTQSRTLNPGNTSVPPSGYAYVVISQTKTFTLTAIEAGTGRPILQQQTVTVDPTIIATSTQDFLGSVGTAGSDGSSELGGDPTAGNGGPGEPLADVTVSLGPLDTSSSPQSVVQISYIAGAGGRGGNGGAELLGGQNAPGGNGGDGGDATTITLEFAATGAPQQIVLNVQASQGGAGGTGGGFNNQHGPDGTPGHDGSVPVVRFVEAEIS